ncbi:RabGAP/TBC protein [Dunaliella salina]|uniref:RabGAP/TBC protein n=1 Tax=Dunaliella salina TaxID=3046 RepID=A0ABQ7H3Q2_DUNSA|nr:RabGAP/TBC protein [Dunaliella salina]|eukprot:KAF5841500.1 RabGAP/TBC protein [Dunaliella salina]
MLREPGTSLQNDGERHLNAGAQPCFMLRQELQGSYINVNNLKRLGFHGVPSEPGLRAVVWKVLLGYLSRSPDEWDQLLARRRTEYHIFCDELIVDPKQPMYSRDGVPGGPLPSTQQQQAHSDQGSPLQPESHCEDVTGQDHPLCLDAASRWNTYFQDNETLEQITRDVVRTHPDMQFFTGESEASELHRQEMRRALFMYAKLNPGLRYIQGMNELIAPLYYLFKNDPDPHARAYAEADAFWCFMELISEFRDHFCQQLDNAPTGIRATIRRLMSLLQHCDRELWYHMEVKCKVDPQFYAFRWITLCLAQEFAFPDTLRIWDTILSDPHGRMDCLLRICTSMIILARERLLKGDFAVIMKTLQRYPPLDVSILLDHASSLPSCSELGMSW